MSASLNKSDSWKRARASDIAKVVLARLHEAQYDDLYKTILKREFGLDSTPPRRNKISVADKYIKDFSGE